MLAQLVSVALTASVKRVSVALTTCFLVTDGELFRDPFAFLAANSPGGAQQGVTTVTAECKFDKC